MLVWCRDSGPDTGAPLPPLQPVESPAEDYLESGGNGDGLESRPMPTCAGLGASSFREYAQEVMSFSVATAVGTCPDKYCEVWYKTDVQADSGTGSASSGCI